jgi:hypothetical protein
MKESIPPADLLRNPQAVNVAVLSIVVQDRAEAALLGEQRMAAEAEQVEGERLVDLLLAVALAFDGDRPGRLAGAQVSVPVLAT